MLSTTAISGSFASSRLHRSRRAGLALLLLLAGAAPASAAEIVAFDAKVSGMGAIVDGDDAAFQARHQVRSGGSGGVEEFFLQADLGANRDLKFEGRALLDNHDYLARLLVREEDLGYLDAGYREYRHWYDASGGYFPPTDAYFSLSNDEHAVDRSSAWIEGGLRKPDLPEITLRYAHDTRDGRKGSLAWGATTQTDGLGPRAIVPAFLSIDERRDSVAIDVAHRFRKNTTLGGGFRWESWRSDDSRNMAQQPGEMGAERFVSQENDIDTDLINVRAYALNTLPRQRLQVTTSYSYTQLDSDVGGSRIYGDSWGAVFDPAFANRQAHDLGFTSLDSSSELAEHIGTLNALYLPTRTLRLRVATRVRNQDIESDSMQEQSNVVSSGVLPFLQTTLAPLRGDSNSGTLSVDETIELRYTGVRNLVVYTRADLEQRHGDIAERLLDSGADQLRFARETVLDGIDQRYAAGANWYPLRRLMVSAKGYYANQQHDYSHRRDSTDNARTSPDRYSAYIESNDIRRYGTQAAATWTVSGVRLRGSYDYQHSNIDTRKDELDRERAAEIRSHIFGASVSYSPGATYFQAAGNYVDNETDTPADDLSGVSGEVVRIVANDYFTAQTIAGAVLDERTDLQALYTFYLADNYENNSRFSQPYGSDLQEHGISLGLRRQLTDAIEGTVRYGFYTSDNDETGGFDDYDGHLVYGSIRYAF